MDDPLAGLSKQQAMLVLTAVAFGGPASLQALERLPEGQEQLLTVRAREILELPRERRVPYLVQEIKRLVASKRTDWLQGASAARVAAALQGERASVVEVVLRALPASLARDARLALRHTPVKLAREIRPALLAALRSQFEDRLARTPPPPDPSLSDLPRLSAAELEALCDALGARSLATALAAVGGAERDEHLARLSPKQRDAAERGGSAGPRINRVLARQRLDQAFASSDPQQAVRDLGLRRLARACLATSESLAHEVAETCGGDLARALASLADEERANPRADGEACRREALCELQALAVRDERPGAAPSAETAFQPAQLSPGARRPKP